jgi:hypothetical protein
MKSIALQWEDIPDEVKEEVKEKWSKILIHGAKYCDKELGIYYWNFCALCNYVADYYKIRHYLENIVSEIYGGVIVENCHFCPLSYGKWIEKKFCVYGIKSKSALASLEQNVIVDFLNMIEEEK